MARHHICSFLSAVAAGAIMSAAAPVTAAEPDAGGMRQQQPDAGPGNFLRQNPGSLPDGMRPRPPDRLQDSLRRDVVPDRSILPPRGIPDARGLQFPQNVRQKGGSKELTYRGNRYVVSGGRWYQQRGNDLTAVDPPAGVLVEDLPEGYAMRWFGGVPYFYADGFYYVWRERVQRYEILQSPPTDERPPSGETRKDAAREPAVTP